MFLSMMPFSALNKAQTNVPPEKPKQGPEAPCKELAICWSLAKVERVMALADSGAECRLVYGKPGQFPGPGAYSDGYGGQMM